MVQPSAIYRRRPAAVLRRTEDNDGIGRMLLVEACLTHDLDADIRDECECAERQQ
jgi:hypothetical protein